MKISKSKSTKRFNFNLNRNTVSHQRGSNTFSIGTRVDGNPTNYDVASSRITMTVKEAKAFQNFLNSYIDGKTTVND